MKAIILAAGRGSRLKSLTDDRPKALVELGGQPLIAWQIAALRAAGAGPIGIVTGYRGTQFDNWGNVRFANARWAETNMVRSLLTAEAWLREGPCIVSYSDIFYAPDVPAGLMAMPGDDLAISFDPAWAALWSARFANPLADAESFRLGADGRITEIGARAQAMADIQGQYMGMLRFTPTSFAQVTQLLAGLDAAAIDKLDMTSLLSRLIGAGVPVRGVPVASRWGEVDDADDLALYESWIANGRLTVPT